MSARPIVPQVYAHQIQRALDRAYRAASAVEAAHPGLYLELTINLAGWCDPEADGWPDILVNACHVEGAEDESLALGVHLTEHRMRLMMQRLAARVSPVPDPAA
jgi:hypothetical protein